MHEFYIRPGSRLSTKNTADWNARYYEKGLAILFTKSQLISKAIYGLLNSPQKQTDEFVLFAFLLFTAKKSNSSVFWENLRFANLLFDFIWPLGLDGLWSF